MKEYVWLVLHTSAFKDDVVSIWTTEKLASAALYVHEKNRPGVKYKVKKWQLNVSFSQWD